MRIKISIYIESQCPHAQMPICIHIYEYLRSSVVHVSVFILKEYNLEECWNTGMTHFTEEVESPQRPLWLAYILECLVSTVPTFTETYRNSNVQNTYPQLTGVWEYSEELFQNGEIPLHISRADLLREQRFRECWVHSSQSITYSTRVCRSRVLGSDSQISHHGSPGTNR